MLIDFEEISNIKIFVNFRSDTNLYVVNFDFIVLTFTCLEKMSDLGIYINILNTVSGYFVCHNGVDFEFVGLNLDQAGHFHGLSRSGIHSRYHLKLRSNLFGIRKALQHRLVVATRN